MSNENNTYTRKIIHTVMRIFNCLGLLCYLNKVYPTVTLLIRKIVTEIKLGITVIELTIQNSCL